MKSAGQVFGSRCKKMLAVRQPYKEARVGLFRPKSVRWRP
jgi:hypothetical protein